MKLFVITLIVACAVALTATAQPRRGDDGGRGYGRSDYERGYRDARRSYYRDRRPGYRYREGYGWYDPSAAIGGAIGGWLWRQFNQPEPPPQPPVVVVQPPPVVYQEPIRDVAWCVRRYKSYNPSTGLYLGYDGHYHPCP